MIVENKPDSELLHVVLGATGSTGSYVIGELLSRGVTDIRGINRSGRGSHSKVDYVATDVRNNLEGLKNAVQGADIVYHCIGLPDYTYWMKNFPPITNNVIEAVTVNGPGTKLVYLDNLYAFGEEAARKGPLTGLTPHRPSGKKAKLRSTINNQFMEAHDQGRFKVTVGHASDFYGPACRSSILDIFVFNNVAKGKGVRMLADKTKKHSFAYAPDIGRAMVDLGFSQNSWGKRWMLPHGEALSIEEMINTTYQVTDQEPQKIGSLPSFGPKVFGTIGKFIPLKALKMLGEVDELKYQFYIDFTVDSSQFEKEFGWQATPIEEGLEKTMKWYLKANEAPT
jgi:nucleoside-diphosphate-sugar epimerase